MSQIKISCVGSTAVFTNTPNIFSGGNVDEVKFEFDKEWVDFTDKTAVFYTNPKETAVQILDTNDVARIPPNMLTKKGKLSIGVIGTKVNGDIKASKILTYIVGKGAVTDDMETTAPTPDIWLQLFSIVKHNEHIVDNMNLLVDESQMPNKANKDLSNVSVDDLVNKGMARVLIDSYTGDGAETRFINLGVTPKAVLVCSSKYGFHSDGEMYGGLAITGTPCKYGDIPIVEIVNNGFNVGYRDTSSTQDEDACTNVSSELYSYIAFI